MDNTNHTTEHRNGQHLLNEERHEIEVRLKDGWTVYRIAKQLGRPYNTIKNEIRRGTVSLYNGKQKRYKADEGERVYKEKRRRCRRIYQCLKAVRFLRYVVTMCRSAAKWSLDAACGAALKSGKFRRSEMVCTKTLYNYVDLGLLPIKNIDLPEKLSRNTKTEKVRKNKRNLGTSIEGRPESVPAGGRRSESVFHPSVLLLGERYQRMPQPYAASVHPHEKEYFRLRRR